MPAYIAITFTPVQGFIEKSRKLRDLFGASAILSYLSSRVVESARASGLTVISPGQVNVQVGMTNRILIKGYFCQKDAEDAIISAWRHILKTCKDWIERELRYGYAWDEENKHWIKDQLPQKYVWNREWDLWSNHTWDITWASGDSITAVMQNLEAKKLSRNWTGINWIGESSSLTGTDAIAWPQMALKREDILNFNWTAEKEQIKEFYKQLAWVLEGKKVNEQPEGKFLDPSERVSIPELVKRMVTREEDISKQFPGMHSLGTSFAEIIRKPEPGIHDGQWTGWFMGDGDKVGDRLKSLAGRDDGDRAISDFSDRMREWGASFQKNFQLGRIIYAGGDDFLGVIYNTDPKTPRTPRDAYDWLRKLNAQWHTHEQGINLSVGFVWAAPSVPQRDVLQHCREAERIAKEQGRDRVTIRVLFNSGQYVQWTCPWDYLHVLDLYCDRDNQSHSKANWSHVYQDWQRMKTSRAIDFTLDEKQIDERVALALFNLYFSEQEAYIMESENRLKIVGSKDSSKKIVDWINNLIEVGWQLC